METSYSAESNLPRENEELLTDEQLVIRALVDELFKKLKY